MIVDCCSTHRRHSQVFKCVLFSYYCARIWPLRQMIWCMSDCIWQPPKFTLKYDGIAIRYCLAWDVSLISVLIMRSHAQFDVWYQEKRVSASTGSNSYFSWSAKNGFCRSDVMPKWALMFANAWRIGVVVSWSGFQQKIKVFQSDWERSSYFYGTSSLTIFIELVFCSFFAARPDH